MSQRNVRVRLMVLRRFVHAAFQTLRKKMIREIFQAHYFNFSRKKEKKTKTKRDTPTTRFWFRLLIDRIHLEVPNMKKQKISTH